MNKKQKETDARNFTLRFRAQLIWEALFLLNQAHNKLRWIDKYYDCSKNPDFDDLNQIRDVCQFFDFAYEELEDLWDRNHEFLQKPSQEVEKANGRRTRNNGRKTKR
jgi:hypothetical protein